MLKLSTIFSLCRNRDAYPTFTTIRYIGFNCYQQIMKNQPSIKWLNSDKWIKRKNKFIHFKTFQRRILKRFCSNYNPSTILIIPDSNMNKSQFNILQTSIKHFSPNNIDIELVQIFHIIANILKTSLHKYYPTNSNINDPVKNIQYFKILVY